MNALKSTKALILTSVLGLFMAIGSVAYTQPFDAGLAEAPESPVADSENPADIAPTEPGLPAVPPKAAAREAETAPTSADPEIVSSEATAEPDNPAKAAPVDTATDVYQALKDGKWLVAFGGVLMFLVWLLRSLLLFFDVKWAKGELGGNIVAFGTAFSLAVATALLAGQGLSLGLFSAAAGAGWLAKGAWSHAQARKGKARANASMGDTAAYEKGFADAEEKAKK